MAAYTDNSFKQRVVIEFLMKEGMASREISDRLKNVCGESALSFPSVRQWLADFKRGRSDTIDKPRSCIAFIFQNVIVTCLGWLGFLLLDFLPKGKQ